MNISKGLEYGKQVNKTMVRSKDAQGDSEGAEWLDCQEVLQ